MGYHVILSPRSIRDLEETVRYIAPHNPAAAKALGLALIARTKTLSEFPEIGRMVPEFGLPSIREIIFKSFRIVYRVNHESRVVEVSRFWHAPEARPICRPPSESCGCLPIKIPGIGFSTRQVSVHGSLAPP